MDKIVYDLKGIKIVEHDGCCKLCRKFASANWALMGEYCRTCNRELKLKWENGLSMQTNATYEEYVETLLLAVKLDNMK